MENQINNPQTNPFPQPKKKTSIGKIILYVFLGFIALGILGAIFGDDKDVSTAAKSEVSSNESTEAASNEEAPVVNKEKEEILSKLKARAAKDWPDDYTTQEFWVNQQMEDYEYMLTIEDNSIKKKAQRDWPLDFSTQKFWYNEQIAAKDRIGQ